MAEFDPDTMSELEGSTDQTISFAGEAADSGSSPVRIGRYRIQKLLGQGGFGLVYLAHDEQLDRLVAVKVPHAKHLSRPDSAELYLKEARIVAQLDHPGIVPVHDVGSTTEIPCYIVSKYINGCNLSALIRDRRPQNRGAAELVALVAEALHYAHKQGLVHRDIKPGNILIDGEGRPHVVDFGMALKEEDTEQGPGFVGTPAYMSPEQARGEGHRVDGRSDVFSLGVVFYELLTGRRIWSTSGREGFLNQMAERDPRPPRQIDDTIPRELERVCLKCLAQRASDRYTTALDLAEDLWHFLGGRVTQVGRTEAATTVGGKPLEVTGDPSTSIASVSDSIPIRVIPKGLRSFDEHDADFFLELLPGPRDRTGLPEILRFWKSQIESTDPNQTFTIGMIYGPSGCGKSSLVKAGLLPRLSKSVRRVYLEATPEGTETRLLNSLRKHCPTIGDKFNLKESLMAFRRQHSAIVGEKVLIILDQFEQWLHSHRHDGGTELVQALRQCDGTSVQCIVLVRDDFWMAASRFMRDLEVPLRESVNCTAVDLFPIHHAEKVLSAFGRAFAILPDERKSVTADQNDFIRKSVAGLADDGRVICVRLALFAEMVKEKEWNSQTLEGIGGTAGVGVTFLEETFGPGGPLAIRTHQAAARGILKSLLPPSGTNIRGLMKSYDELLTASGYSNHITAFNELIRILDSDIRLITPADPHGLETIDEKRGPESSDQRFYQLSHDYLVQSIRDWLTRKQKETRRGRAELLLEEYAANWNAKPDNRRLPTMLEYLSIRRQLPRRSWSSSERRMMQTAGRVHGLRLGSVLALLIITAFSIRSYLESQAAYVSAQKTQNQQQQAALLVKSVLEAPADAVPYAINNLNGFQTFATPIIERILDDAKADPVQRLRAATVMAEYGDTRHQFLVDTIATAPPVECHNIVQALTHAPQAAIKSLKEAAGRADTLQKWRLKSRYAILLMYLGDTAVARQMSELGPDPVQRVQFIDTIPTWHSRIDRLITIADQSESNSLRAAICLGIESINVEQLTPAELVPVTTTIGSWYTTRPDAGTRSAAGLVLRQWRQQLPISQTTSRTPEDRDWYVNPLNMTMIRIPPASEQLASGNESSVSQPTRSFWLSDREVSRRLFQQFVDDPDYPANLKSPDWNGPDNARSPTLDHPVQQVNWIDAMRFCNWLSHKEQLQPGYVLTGGSWEVDSTANGYRLPFELEWELACRAGATTPYVSGDEELLSRFAVYESNRTLPCGSKLPNGWGFFDMHGNVYEWCQDLWVDSESVVPTKNSKNAGDRRVLRSGAFDYSALQSRANQRNQAAVRYRSYTIGFRPGRNG